MLASAFTVSVFTVDVKKLFHTDEACPAVPPYFQGYLLETLALHCVTLTG
jgi:hypothetical protein